MLHSPYRTELAKLANYPRSSVEHFTDTTCARVLADEASVA